MKKSHIALFLGGALLVASSGMIAACSSSDSSGNPSGGGGQDGGGTTKDGSSGGNDSGGGGGNDSGPIPDGGTPDCGKIPGLHPSDAGSIFCAYAPNDGGPLNCGTGQECCLGGKQGSGFAPEQCSNFGTACTNGDDGGLPVQCEQSADCTANNAGSACCLRGSTPQEVVGCGYFQAKGGSGVYCAGSGKSACAAGEVQVCSSNGDCPTGQTCHPMKWKILQLGFCQ